MKKTDQKRACLINIIKKKLSNYSGTGQGRAVELILGRSDLRGFCLLILKSTYCWNIGKRIRSNTLLRPVRSMMHELFALMLCLFLLPFGCDTNRERIKTDCAIQEGQCVKDVGKDGITAAFDIGPKPVKTMTRLAFRADIRKMGKPVTDAAVVLSLTMPGMYMGDNRYLLEHKGKGRYEANGVIIRCPSGRKVWQAELGIRLPEKGPEETLFARYIFEVGN